MSLPTIEVYLSEKYDSYCLSCQRNRGKFCFGIFILTIIGAIIGIVVSNSNSNTYPCLVYSPQTLANSVSLACLRYIWSLNCKIPSLYPPDGYQGWWNQSPQGQTMVSCATLSTQCGAGSFGNTAIYMQYCNPNYTGL